DAWVLGRIICGLGVNGELDDLSPRFHDIADHLESLSPGERPGAWTAFLCGQPDRQLIIRTIADIDPDGPPPSPAEAEVRPRFKMTRAVDIAPRPVEFLWGKRVPRGMLSLFAGDPKLGKSLVTVAMAAAVSRGAALPGDDTPDGPGDVVLLSA